QPLAFGQDRGKLAEPGRRGLRHADDAGALLEIVDAERRGEARAAGSGQDVVRPRAIVADRLGAPAAEENGARVSQPWQPGLRVLHRQLEVLWRDAVGKRARLLEVAGLDERSTRLQRRGDRKSTR